MTIVTSESDIPVEPENPATRAVMGNFSIGAQMANGKSFSVSGYLFDKESEESLNARLDILHDVTDRQRLRSEIPELEAKRDQMIKQLDQIKEHMLAIEKKKATGKPLPTQERVALENINVNLEKLQKDIDKGAVAIAEAKAKTGMT